MPDFGIMRGFNEKLFGDKLVAGQLPTQLGNNFDPDAVAFFDRVTAAGGSLSATEKTAVNTLVVQMKLDEIWTPMKAIYPMVGASAAACAQNLKSSSFTGTFSSGWTFASTGVTPNGTSAYMDTFLNPSTILSSLDSNHLSYYSRTNSTLGIAPSEIGCVNTTTGQDLELFLGRSSAPTTTAYVANNYNNNLLSGSNGGSTLGFYNGSRNSSTSLKLYKNGTLLNTLTTARSGNYNNYPIAIGNLRDSATTLSGICYSNKQCAFASIGDGLTDTEASNFYTAVQAMQTTLSRQV